MDVQNCNRLLCNDNILKTYMHTTFICIYSHISVCTQAHRCTHTHTHACTHPPPHTHTHSHSQTHTHSHMQVSTNTPTKSDTEKAEIPKSINRKQWPQCTETAAGFPTCSPVSGGQSPVHWSDSMAQMTTAQRTVFHDPWITNHNCQRREGVSEETFLFNCYDCIGQSSILN